MLGSRTELRGTGAFTGGLDKNMLKGGDSQPDRRGARHGGGRGAQSPAPSPYPALPAPPRVGPPASSVNPESRDVYGDFLAGAGSVLGSRSRPPPLPGGWALARLKSCKLLIMAGPSGGQPLLRKPPVVTSLGQKLLPLSEKIHGTQALWVRDPDAPGASDLGS